MNESVELSVEEGRDLALAAMLRYGFGVPEATVTVDALLGAERDGLPSHGLARLPYYLDQAACGKVKVAAVPRLEMEGAVVRVDAGYGLAFPAVAKGLTAGLDCAARLGIAAVAIARSHHFGAAGAPVEHAARQGYLALAFSNAPSAIAPWGGRRPLYGTNPIAFACPRRQADPLLIDLSLSKVARGKVMLAKRRREPIPIGWALDAEGQPTSNADAAIAGSMLPAGEAKGAALALMVELLTAGLTGSNFGFQASSFLDAEGGPPGIAQLILLIEPGRFSPGFVEHAETMFAAMQGQAGVRLPGDRRYACRRERDTRLTLPSALVATLRAHAGVA
ncbi:Ldh family oxidoreductase [Halomonas sp. MCCC 1A17488]|uniref:Ldh family oxidoreductase n=1 Tax=Billgrantia sulfidoxydans TaxID=2733484 RepID=A0ABX7WAV2_9GAMM|nr:MULTISPECIES: Ldh family oxidoreductase [Halomonas]MCE8017658.1 Ldh family oxidoreductase [Halomonas sp. MCCC 1A17488]MCG3240991.1 Ldh family oxidoreductase [Halomonas sp. MCCC 1A17488]QPP48859.1 Ldh family oxidoreductase [Halomonas sp. SS10-MC5]QTP56188.1 Ldh family oxidoreductase [Halomonas sulfidoxydans]